jgi:hypothetical protein
VVAKTAPSDELEIERFRHYHNINIQLRELKRKMEKLGAEIHDLESRLGDEVQYKQRVFLAYLTETFFYRRRMKRLKQKLSKLKGKGRR